MKHTPGLRNCSVIILAGGGSRRMGFDKALLEYEGQPAVEYIAGQLQAHFSDIIISVNSGQSFSVAGCRMVVDERNDFGPLAGIASGLRVARHDKVFVLAVDSPAMDFNLFGQLLDNIDDYLAVIPDCNGAPQPLYALYSKAALTVIDELINNNLHRAGLLAELATVKVLKCDSIRVENINTRADYEQYLPDGQPTVFRTITSYNNGFAESKTDELINEQRIELHTPDAQQFLCTPVNLRELFVGWGYTRGLLTDKSDVVMLKRTAALKYLAQFNAHGRVAAVSRELIRPEAALLQKMQRVFLERQKIFRRTGAAHAAGFFDEQGRLLSFFEDIGRHNALDKAIGALVIADCVRRARYLLLSSRVSIELLEKLRYVPVGAVCAVSAPSDAAVELAEQLGLALIGFFRDNRYNFYNDKENQ